MICRRDMAVALCHGILTRQTDLSWPDRLEVWLRFEDHRIWPVKKEYFAGFLPPWNVWARNWLLAYGLAAEMEQYARRGVLLGMVGHSNGADVIQKTLRILGRRGVRTEIIILIGAAAQADVVKSGVAGLIAQGLLGRAIAWSSEGDLAVASPLIWPYGRLGHTGWTLAGERYAAERLATLWHEGGHSDYFAEERRQKTFAEIHRELALARAAAGRRLKTED